MRIKTTVTADMINCPKDGDMSKSDCQRCEYFGGLHTVSYGQGAVIDCKYKADIVKKDISDLSDEELQQAINDNEIKIRDISADRQRLQRESEGIRRLLTGTVKPNNEGDVIKKSSLTEYAERAKKNGFGL